MPAAVQTRTQRRECAWRRPQPGGRSPIIARAAAEERRRIERDLHDGAQQRLVALALRLRCAQRQLAGGAGLEVARVLTEAVDELGAAVEELRELARGVQPALLADEGLAAALASLAGRLPFPVSLDVPEERLPAQVEATAYFVACEALANAAKHAQASRAAVSARLRAGLFVLEVEDDGVGGAQLWSGSGLHGLADRVEALGGRLWVESPAGVGTRVVGVMPGTSRP
jgi:signal transduction histidine kinase